MHVNKGLARATADVLAAAKDTAMNPAVLDAFITGVASTRVEVQRCSWANEPGRTGP